MPAAIRSALTNTGQPASLGRNSLAKVVLPAPFGPAMMTIFFAYSYCGFVSHAIFRLKVGLEISHRRWEAQVAP